MHRSIERTLDGGEAPSDTFGAWWVAYLARFPGREPFRTEMPLRSDAGLCLTGVVDAIFWDPSPAPPGAPLTLHLVDWKRSESIVEGSPNYVLGCLQLNVYRFLLEEYYDGFVVDGVRRGKTSVGTMSIVVFRGTADGWESLGVPCMQTSVREMVRSRRLDLARSGGAGKAAAGARDTPGQSNHACGGCRQ